jgi:hypothetical protein
MNKNKYLKYKNKYLKYKNKYLKLKNQLGGAKFCNPEELMSNPNYEIECINIGCANGSCSHPSFRDGLDDLTDEICNKNITIFTLILEKNNIKYLDIILGAIEQTHSDFDDLGNSLQLCITPINSFDDFDILKSKIENIDNLGGNILTFNSEFPLNFQKRNCQKILDLLLRINDSIKVRITNRMCGTCHRSLYYLVQQGINYIVNPEQGLNNDLDTPEIIKCFKNITYTKFKDGYIVYDKDIADNDEEYAGTIVPSYPPLI